MTLKIPEFREVRILVVGDVMLDRYWSGPVARISPEAPVPVVQVENEEDRPGGAANVAVNLASLGVNARLLGLVADDQPGRRLGELLELLPVDCQLVVASGRRTVTKLRVQNRNQQLIRLDFEGDLDGPGIGEFEAAFSDSLEETDLVILSDYAKGTLAGVAGLIELCRERRIPVLVDPKGEDFSRYAGAAVITPNLSEFQRVVGACDSESALEEEGRRLRGDLGLEALVVTRGERGLSVIESDGTCSHLPAEVREVFDVTGAGDTVAAVLGAGLAAGMSVVDAAQMANLAAGLVVRKLGVATVTASELNLALHARGRGGSGILTREQLLPAVREAQARGEKVVFTNGCFDLLHAGHIAYLEEAKSLGARLVVAVNDDDSVRALKGSGRPINPLGDRLAVLAGLAAVDWVVPFSEDTPSELIATLLPDILVKGGDYRTEDIAGAEDVQRNGGEVRVLPFLEGRSTSAIIATIRRQ